MLQNQVEVVRVKAGLLAIELIGKDEFGFWSRIRWKNCLILGEPFSRLVEEHLGLEKGFIVSHEAFEYTQDRKSCRPCIIFYVSNSLAIENDAKEKIQLLAVEFISRIVDEANLQLDLPKGMQSDQSVITVAAEHAHIFLKDHGGDKLATPLLIQSFSLTAEIRKGFLPKPPFQPKDPEKFQLSAQVVLLGVFTRKCSLFAFENETEASYSPNQFFAKLKDMLGEALVAEFVLERTWDASGKENIRITSMGQIKPLPDLLI